MSHFEKHVQNKAGSQDIVGRRVGSMTVLKAKTLESGTNFLKLECSVCDKKFNFEEREGGDHAVMRDGVVMAQCPNCHAEWDGETRKCWALLTRSESVTPLGRESVPPEIMAQAMMKLGASHPSQVNAMGIQHETTIGLVDIVQAANPIEAMAKIGSGLDATGMATIGDCMMVEAPYPLWESYQKFKTIANIVREQGGPRPGESPGDTFARVMREQGMPQPTTAQQTDDVLGQS